MPVLSLVISMPEGFPEGRKAALLRVADGTGGEQDRGRVLDEAAVWAAEAAVSEAASHWDRLGIGTQRGGWYGDHRV